MVSINGEAVFWCCSFWREIEHTWATIWEHNVANCFSEGFAWVFLLDKNSRSVNFQSLQCTQWHQTVFLWSIPDITRESHSHVLDETSVGLDEIQHLFLKAGITDRTLSHCVPVIIAHDETVPCLDGHQCKSEPVLVTIGIEVVWVVV